MRPLILIPAVVLLLGSAAGCGGARSARTTSAGPTARAADPAPDAGPVPNDPVPAAARPAGEPRRLEGAKRAVYCVAFSPDGRHVVAGGNEKVVRLWDAATGALVRTLEGHHTPVRAVAFSPDGKWALTGSGGFDPDAIPPPGPLPPPVDNVVRLFEVASGEVVRKFEGHTDHVLAVGFSADGRRVLSASTDRTARAWEAETGKELGKAAAAGSDQVMAAAVSPDGRRALLASVTPVLRLLDLEAGKEVKEFKNGRAFVWAVAFSPDGKRALAGSGYFMRPKGADTTFFDTTARLWDPEAGELVRAFEGHATAVTAVAFSPDGKRVITGGGIPHQPPPAAGKQMVTDDSVRVWDAATGKELRRFAGHAGFVSGVAVAPDGRAVASASHDATVRVWELPE